MVMRPDLRQITSADATNGEVPIWNSVTQTWEPGAISDPSLTLYDAKGDLLVGTANDARAKLGVGSNGQVLTADSTQTTGVKWATPSASGSVATDVIFDAKGDLPVGTAADTAARLAVGSNGQVLTADSTQSTGLKWAAAASGSVATDTIFDAKGDLAVGTAADASARLAVGSNGQVLTADSTQSTGVTWATPSAGSSVPPLDTDTLDSTYGDDFAGTSINGRWTRRTVASGNESWERWNAANGVRWGGPPAAGWMYLQTVPAGDFEAHAIVAVDSTATTTLVGPVIVDSSGTGVACGSRINNGAYGVNLSSYAFSSYSSVAVPATISYTKVPMKLSIKKVGTAYSVAYRLYPSYLATEWSSTTFTWAGTPNRVGLGCFFTDSGLTSITLLRFNIV